MKLIRLIPIGVSDEIPTSVFKVHEERSQNCGKRLLAASCLSKCLSVRIKKIGSDWTHFHKISSLSFFLEYLSIKNPSLIKI